MTFRYTFPTIFVLLYAVETLAFQVFDATLYSDKPDLRIYGVEPLTVVYGHKTYPPGADLHELPSRGTIEDLAKKLARSEKMVVLDYERWPVQGYRNIPQFMPKNRDKYFALLDWFKSSAPDVEFGYFGIVPINNYVSSLSPPNSRRHQEWREDNENMRDLAAHIDIAFVEAYTYEESFSNWQKALDEHLLQLRKLFSGKVYLFLWPQYFDHAPTIDHLQLNYLPRNLWRQQLDASISRADGVVIWGGWDFEKNKPEKWDNSAPWWRETIKFIENKNATNPMPPTLNE